MRGEARSRNCLRGSGSPSKGDSQNVRAGFFRRLDQSPGRPEKMIGHQLPQVACPYVVRRGRHPLETSSTGDSWLRLQASTRRATS